MKLKKKMPQVNVKLLAMKLTYNSLKRVVLLKKLINIWNDLKNLRLIR